MADFLFRVNGRDLTSYVRTQHSEGLDPADPDYSQPQFSGSPAFTEGAQWVSDAVSNREWTVPLFLSADSLDALHELIRDINADLVRGAEVEFRMQGATETTHFDLERGRLDVEFQYWIARASRVRATLRLWTRPYGHTGTSRVVASLQSTGPQVIDATGILGDRSAFMNLEVRVGSRVASTGRLVAFGVHRSASYNPVHTASDGLLEAQASSVVVGASGAVASKYLGIPISPTGASGIAARDYLTPPAGHVGRHRVFAIMRTRIDNAAVYVHAKDRFGAALGPTQQATVTDPGAWQVVDLGEVQVPERDSGQEAVPTQYVELVAGGASGGTAVASRGLHLNGLVYLPLDESAGVMVAPGYGADSQVVSDGFSRLAAGQLLHNSPQADSGQSWQRVAGYLGRETNIGAGLIGALDSGAGASAGATGLYDIDRGTLRSDLLFETEVQMHGTPSAGASGAIVEAWPLSQAASGAATVGVRAKLHIGPSANLHLALISHDGSATTLHASAGLGASSASALYGGQTMRLTVRTLGDLADVWLATGARPATPILSATHANFRIAGWPALGMRSGAPGETRDMPTVDSVAVYSADASAPDAAAREWFRIESHPDSRAVRANASVFAADLADRYRGGAPRLVSTGSPVASGPAKVVVLTGAPGDLQGNDVVDVVIRARERFRYLR